MPYLGLDGCRAGWVAAGADLEIKGEEKFFIRLYESMEELWREQDDVRLILIDIPIGLKEKGPEERRCDKEARALLDRFKSSVFPVPCRQALKAESWEEANRINKKYCGGKGLSKQSWGIADKVAEVDQFLTKTPEAKSIMRESHPEVVFWALNGGKEIQHSKKETAGLDERIALLENFIPEARQLIAEAREKHGGSLKKDDICDAIALLVAARRCEHNLISLPQEEAVREVDPRGLKMEIVYPAISGQKTPAGKNDVAGRNFCAPSGNMGGEMIKLCAEDEKTGKTNIEDSSAAETKPGMFHLYTGTGKGKTTAALGLSLRALGAGKRVFFAQFVKGKRYSELNIIENLENIELKQYGRRCFIRGEPEEEDIRLAREGLEEAGEILKAGDHELVVLDEATIALHYELFTAEELLRAIDSRAPGVEVVVTGRPRYEELEEAADLATDMNKIKHYFDRDVPARTGIEK